nr:hypothetical protein [Tanacetum cinerariifolium]GEX53055.1 hypothetical protein [Tanacetum cinerariifolium]
MKTILWTIAALFENQWSNEVDVPIAKPIVAEPNPIAAKPNHNSVKETSFSGDVVEGVTLVSRVYNDDSSKSTGTSKWQTQDQSLTLTPAIPRHGIRKTQEHIPSSCPV